MEMADVLDGLKHASGLLTVAGLPDPEVRQERQSASQSRSHRLSDVDRQRQS